MIVVTGASGQLGRLIVNHLLQGLPADRIGVSVRDVAKADDLQALGVRVKEADFAEPEGLEAAFEGAEQVLIVSSNARSYGGDPLSQHRAAIDAARAVSARRIVYTSHMGASASSLFPPMLDHAATEMMLRECGVAWTALRNGFYAASGIALLGDAKQTGLVEAPADGPVSWTSHDDLAAAAAAVLLNEGRFEGPTPPLTGAEALNLADLAALAQIAWRRSVERSTITDDEFSRRLAARGLPSRAADIAVGLYKASRDGEFSRVDPTLAHLLGRPPVSMQTCLESNNVLGQKGI